MKTHYISGSVQVRNGSTVPLISSKLTWRDYWGTLMVRTALNRGNYKVTPGLYALGNTGPDSDVFVSANYKLSFDVLRKNLDGLNAWILVLDTKGINVWCAAGKGTFGTKELVRKIQDTKLKEVINHRKVIVPQLGAVGISAHLVEAQSRNDVKNSILQTSDLPFGFNPANLCTSVKPDKGIKVIYGPVRASDIKDFIANGYQSTKKMKAVTFKLADRLKVIPVDFVLGLKKLLIVTALLYFISGWSSAGFSIDLMIQEGWQTVKRILLAYLSGIVITPVLLPWISGRTFSMKGFLVGLLASFLILFPLLEEEGFFEIAGWMMIISAVSSFLAMNFTGSSTFTSLSGVKKEMKIALPFQIAFSSLGLIFFVISRFI